MRQKEIGDQETLTSNSSYGDPGDQTYRYEFSVDSGPRGGSGVVDNPVEKM